VGSIECIRHPELGKKSSRHDPQRQNGWKYQSPGIKPDQSNGSQFATLTSDHQLYDSGSSEGHQREDRGQKYKVFDDRN
jgi:hypothetical protein